VRRKNGRPLEPCSSAVFYMFFHEGEHENGSTKTSRWYIRFSDKEMHVASKREAFQSLIRWQLISAMTKPQRTYKQTTLAISIMHPPTVSANLTLQRSLAILNP
jgi:hypothetical protein